MWLGSQSSLSPEGVTRTAHELKSFKMISDKTSPTNPNTLACEPFQNAAPCGAATKIDNVFSACAERPCLYPWPLVTLSCRIPIAVKSSMTIYAMRIMVLNLGRWKTRFLIILEMSDRWARDGSGEVRVCQNGASDFRKLQAKRRSHWLHASGSVKPITSENCLRKLHAKRETVGVGPSTEIPEHWLQTFGRRT